MIKITSFDLFQGFLQVTHEFHEAKSAVQIKSLTFEHSFEFEYKDVSEISDGFFTSSSTTVGFWVMLSTAWALIIFCNWFYKNLIWLHTIQIIFVSGIILFTIGFIKNRYIFISDKNRNILARIRQSRKNSSAIVQAIKKIKKTSKKITEISSADPFPPSKFPEFEHKYMGFSKFEKTIDKFYKTEIIGSTQSIYGRHAYKIRYDLLNGDTYRGKVSFDIWEFMFPLAGLFLSIIVGIHYGFRVPSWEYTPFISYILIGALIISWFLRFVKREVFGFYNKNGQIEYWAYVNRRDKEKVEKIIEFVKSRIPAEKAAEEQ